MPARSGSGEGGSRTDLMLRLFQVRLGGTMVSVHLVIVRSAALQGQYPEVLGQGVPGFEEQIEVFKRKWVYYL